ncbi:MAG: hypothetical protein ACRD1R_14270 [Acidobacteriota bacterium]
MSNQRGIVLLLALIISVLLSLIGLAVTFSGMNDYRISHEFENLERTLALSDAGFNIAKNSLRGEDLSAVLATSTSVPQYISYIEPESGTYAFRNPLALIEARNVNFNDPPATVGTRQAKGWITAGEGTVIGNGRFFGKITDNEDENPNDPDVDVDGMIYMRVLGVHPSAPSEVESYGGAIKNSVGIIEGLIKRDMSFDMGAPFTVYGPDIDPNVTGFNGNAFLIQGDTQPAISVIYDDPLNGDAGTLQNSITDELAPLQKDNLKGAEGEDGISIRDDTQLVRDSENPDATNIFSAEFLFNFTNKIASVADYKYTDGTSLSGSNIELGTPDDPKITVVEGDFSLSGSGSGAGILVVQGTLEYQGAFDYDGLVLIIGEGSVSFGGANKSLTGGLFLANVVDNGDGSYSFGVPSFSLSGKSEFYFNSSNIKMGMSLLPMKTLSWREITPEIEPAE